ncbi:MAG: protein translocase subunit SecF [Syntrophaceticus sp.]|jgi:preprotein translocase subunit SecF|nr:protein translocase subunit SecF [Syntrophaceticus sp.]MDD3314579.1 protein translocase subunit SecF [Syntrophaceticus sp.]MDD4359775.1 protein translocase subunit SecF [Syntrophaceticus sp.]MDD4782886.1 protein translocase subunit SecF [Syntrophaceticus sp.]
MGMRFSFIKLRKYCYILSLIVIIAGFISLGIQGLNLGIDFTGGSLIELKFEQSVAVEDVRSVLDESGLPQDSTVQESEGNVIMIRTEDLSQEESTKLLQSMEEEFGSYDMLRNESVGPTIGKELRNNAILALVIAFVLMVVYIAIRFELLTGLAAVSGVVHVILITVGLVSIFRLDVDSTFIAALLTIVGYSINDTIVIFDRIRENMGKRKKDDPLDELVNTSVWQTLVRSINTGVSVILALLAMLIFGGTTLKTFVVVMLIGIVVGAYSSIFVSSPLWYDYRRLRGGRL